MKATFDYYSDQMTNRIATPPVMEEPYEDSGKVRVKRFTYTVPTGNIAAETEVALCAIPANCLIIGGACKFAALSAGGGTSDIGIAGADGSGYYTGTTADDPDFFLDGIDTTATAGDTICEVSVNDLNSPYLTTKEVVITATPKTAVWSATRVLSGFIKYVEN